MAISSILGLVGAGAGIASTLINNAKIEDLNKANMYHENDMLRLQAFYNERAANQADERTRALYNDLQSPEAMVKQLNDAGLSVGMMYGNGGIGGNMNSGAQADGVSPTNYGRYTPNPILDANTANLIANAAKLEAETKNIEADTENKEAQRDSTLQDIPIKQRQYIIMGHEISKIDQEIKESEERIKNMTEERINTIAERENIHNEAELKKRQAELTEAQKEYQKALKELTDIDKKYRGKLNQAQINQLQASANNLNSAAKKIGIESDILEKQKSALINKAFFESMNECLEYNLVKPEEIKILQERWRALENDNQKAEMWLDFYKKHPRLYNQKQRNEVLLSGFNLINKVPQQ